jgi:flagellar basal-body rod modification protein FlgD
MSDVSQVLAGSAQSASLSKAAGGQELGKQDFLKLLVTQLENQNPMDPEDPAKFSSQLAQFSSLEQMTNVNENIKDMARSSDAINRMSSLSMLGKEVVMEDNSFTLGSDPVELGYELEDSANKVTLRVKDEAGSVVDEIQCDGLSAGRHFVSWQGQNVPEGEYSFEVEVTRGEETTSGTSLLRSQVSGVDDLGGANRLITPLGEVKLQDVIQVRS